MRYARLLAPVLLLPFVLQCHERSITAPDLTTNLPEDVSATAIRLHVNVASGTIEAMETMANRGVSFNVVGPAVPDPSFSLVGSDGVAIQSSNMNQAPVGNNKMLVRFDIAIRNSLTN